MLVIPVEYLIEIILLPTERPPIANSKFRENGVLVKMDDVEAGIMKSKKEKDNVKETVS